MGKDYLGQLSAAHMSVLDVVDRIQPLLRSYPEARPRLRELSERLLVLFSSEDQDFFNTLYTFYKEDRPSTKMIDFLHHDFKEVKINYLTFFDKHLMDMSNTHAHAFPKDFSAFADMLAGRVKIEQEYLFPLLQKMASG